MANAIAKVVNREDGQEIHLPREFHLDVSEVIVSMLGDRLVLTPCRVCWEGFIEGFQDAGDDLARPDEEASADIPRKTFE